MTAERVEHDSLGEVAVPADRYWGAQTQRSLENFPIGTETCRPCENSEWRGIPSDS